MNFLHFILGLSPILWLIFALIVLKWPTYRAAFGSLLVSIVLAMTVWNESLINCMTASLEGFLMALWPIIIVIIAAVYTYNLSLKTGAMDVIKRLLSSVSSDARILALIIAWCFGGFMEGMAGFGTAVAIPASMLVGLGFEPLMACLLCLIANRIHRDSDCHTGKSAESGKHNTEFHPDHSAFPVHPVMPDLNRHDRR